MITSLKFSKQLKEAGCELGSESHWYDFDKSEKTYELTTKEKISLAGGLGCSYPAYDILNDICVKYKTEFWGKDYLRPLKKINYRYRNGSEIIKRMLQQNKPQEEIEKYIWDNCKFNKIN